MKRLANILGFAVAVAATFAACGAAATLALGTHALSAGNVPVTSCGVSALTATRNVDNTGAVTGLGISNIPAACAGETLSVTLVNGSGSALVTKTLPVPAGGGSLALTGLGAIAATNLMGYRFAVTGS